MCRPIPRDAIKPIQIQAIGSKVATITSPSKRRVRFHETVDVHVIDRLDAFAVRELFYRSVDYHRFRSESCLELLEAQAKTSDPLLSFFQHLFKSIVIVTSQHKQMSAQHTPNWTTDTQVALRFPPGEALLKELAFLV
jgi:hypothetical protein